MVEEGVRKIRERCKQCAFKDEPALCPDDCRVKVEVLKRRSIGLVRGWCVNE